jgi:hypothetical protein
MLWQGLAMGKKDGYMELILGPVSGGQEVETQLDTSRMLLIK